MLVGVTVDVYAMVGKRPILGNKQLANWQLGKKRSAQFYHQILLLSCYHSILTFLSHVWDWNRFCLNICLNRTCSCSVQSEAISISCLNFCLNRTWSVRLVQCTKWSNFYQLWFNLELKLVKKLATKSKNLFSTLWWVDLIFYMQCHKSSIVIN